MADSNLSSTLGGRLYGLLIAALLAIAVAIAGFIYVTVMPGPQQGDRGQLAIASIDVVTAAAQPAAGSAPDFRKLASGARAVDEGVTTLADTSVSSTWKPLKQSVDVIIAGESAYRSAASSAGAIAAAMPGLSNTYTQIADRLATKNAPAASLYLAAGQLIRLERLQNLAIGVLGANGDAQSTIDQINREAQTFLRNNDMLTQGAPGQDYTPLKDATIDALVKQVASDFAPAADAATALSNNAAAVAKLRQASAAVPAQAAAFTSALQRAATASAGGGNLRWIGVVGAALAAVLILLFVVFARNVLDDRERANEDKEARQQQAILSLLDEITNLANGDLTVDVTVTEDFTGAIADSINYTVQTLRSLVGTINDTSAEVVAAAASTQNIARQMSEASERQAREIAGAANAISGTSQSLQEVSGRAEKLAEQAQNSVQTAHTGAGTVGRTIQNMAALREQIQDTAKRIKRLGESSQEIGNITELINDIAEQTNTLALNASIQAAMAGEAGRGFAVVADEVQRLAERAGSATRQIENLVKTIQADTNEAIISMERSTANVIAGAKSAEEAGQALTQIETTSQELSKLIQEIAAATRGQSAEATKVAGTMQGIRQIAVQTSTSADKTSQAVGELNTLSDKLRESVAGFKLPTEA